MHGLISRAFEGFVKSAYGTGIWRKSMVALDTGFDGFETMLHYDDALVSRVVTFCAKALNKPRETLLEDFGTYLVAQGPSSRVRRLLRFGGVDYEDFLHSLDDLAGRAALAVPDLDLPELELRQLDRTQYHLVCRMDFPGVGCVVMGLLRALADDYGALVFLDHVTPQEGAREGDEVISIQLLEAAFSEGRGFDLADRVHVYGGEAG